MNAKSVSVLWGVVWVTMVAVSTCFAGEEGIKLGTLSIEQVPGSRQNLIIRSSVDIKAVFKDESAKTEEYVGEMGISLGIDISYKKDEVLKYIVLSPSSDYKMGSYALEGKYYGADASVSVVGGLSAKVMIGGGKKSFTLQPFALGGNKGIGAAAGLGYLYLQKAPGK